MNVVLIKSESGVRDRFVEELQKNDYYVRAIPSIGSQYKNLDQLGDMLRHHKNYDGIIFTSPRAVHAVANAIEQTDLTVVRHWIVKEFNYSVGEGTYMIVDKLLKMKTKGREAGNALKLSTIIANDYGYRAGRKRLLFACGNMKQDMLEKNLKDKGIALDVIEVYETIQHPNLDFYIKDVNNVQFIVFFSPSAVFFSLPLIRQYKIDISSAKVIAIGPSTEKCLASYNIKSQVCENPTPEGLLNSIKNCV
ncbi:uroporphyrinogen-III synthase-like [Chironomus tepperi]|uniref:uroporphyrinogen-III synthase-like n=1 Tax=Chironomus tepperi TaxID=113505 RepID=UPI00391F46D1